MFDMSAALSRMASRQAHVDRQALLSRIIDRQCREMDEEAIHDEYEQGLARKKEI